MILLALAAVLPRTAIGAQLQLSWNDTSAGQAAFRIERKADPDGTYGELSWQSAGVTTYPDTTALAAPQAYEIQRKVGTRAYEPGGTAPATATSWRDSPVAPGEVRCHQVRSLGDPAGNNSAWTPELCKTASVPVGPAGPPSGVTIQEVIE